MIRRGYPTGLRGHTPAPITDEFLAAASQAARQVSGETVTTERAQGAGMVRFRGSAAAIAKIQPGWRLESVALTVEATQRLIARASVGRALRAVSDGAKDPEGGPSCNQAGESPAAREREIVKLLDEADDAAETARRRSGR